MTRELLEYNRWVGDKFVFVIRQEEYFVDLSFSSSTGRSIFYLKIFIFNNKVKSTAQHIATH